MTQFSQLQEESIERKIELFSPILEKNISQNELMRRVEEIEAKITKKRMEWYEGHKGELDYLSRDDLTDLQKAFTILYVHQMEIPYKELKWVMTYDDEQGIHLLEIQARNFCPYLEAFKRMGINPGDSTKLCELALEGPCKKLIEKVNPNISFWRDYEHIRPAANYCREKMLIKDFSVGKKLKCPPGEFVFSTSQNFSKNLTT